MQELVFYWKKPSIVSIILLIEELEDMLFVSEGLFIRLVYFSFTDQDALHLLFYKLETGISRNKSNIVTNVLDDFDTNNEAVILRLKTTKTSDTWLALQKNIRDLIKKLRFSKSGNKCEAIYDLFKFYYTDSKSPDHQDFYKWFSVAANSYNTKPNDDAMEAVRNIKEYIQAHFVSPLRILNEDLYYSNKQIYNSIYAKHDSILSEFDNIEVLWDSWNKARNQNDNSEREIRKELWTCLETFSDSCNFRGDIDKPDDRSVNTSLMKFIKNLRTRPIETFKETMESVVKDRPNNIEWNYLNLTAISNNDVFLYIHKPVLEDVFQIIIQNKLKHWKDETGVKIDYSFKTEDQVVKFQITQNRPFKKDPLDTEKKVNYLLGPYRSKLEIIRTDNECTFAFSLYNRIEIG